jgi:hypothetical protein
MAACCHCNRHFKPREPCHQFCDRCWRLPCKRCGPTSSRRARARACAGAAERRRVTGRASIHPTREDGRKKREGMLRNLRRTLLGVERKPTREVPSDVSLTEWAAKSMALSDARDDREVEAGCCSAGGRGHSGITLIPPSWARCRGWRIERLSRFKPDPDAREFDSLTRQLGGVVRVVVGAPTGRRRHPEPP